MEFDYRRTDFPVDFPGDFPGDFPVDFPGDFPVDFPGDFPGDSLVVVDSSPVAHLARLAAD